MQILSRAVLLKACPGQQVIKANPSAIVTEQQSIACVRALHMLPFYVSMTTYDQIPNPSVRFINTNLHYSPATSLHHGYCSCRPGYETSASVTNETVSNILSCKLKLPLHLSRIKHQSCHSTGLDNITHPEVYHSSNLIYLKFYK